YWRPSPSRGSAGARRFAGENPPGDAQIYYSLKQRTGSISLRILDAMGDTVREFEPSGEPGLHRIDWDLRRSGGGVGGGGLGGGGPGGRGGRGGLRAAFGMAGGRGAPEGAAGGRGGFGGGGGGGGGGGAAAGAGAGAPGAGGGPPGGGGRGGFFNRGRL